MNDDVDLKINTIRFGGSHENETEKERHRNRFILLNIDWYVNIIYSIGRMAEWPNQMRK